MQQVRLFRTHAETLGRDDLILPVHYLDVNAFATMRRGDCFDTEVFDYLRSLQWVDFRALEPLASDTERVRVWLTKFASQIVETLYRAVLPPTEPVPVHPVETRPIKRRHPSRTCLPPKRPPHVAKSAPRPDKPVPELDPPAKSTREPIPCWRSRIVWWSAATALIVVLFG